MTLPMPYLDELSSSDSSERKYSRLTPPLPALAFLEAAAPDGDFLPEGDEPSLGLEPALCGWTESFLLLAARKGWVRGRTPFKG